MSTLKLNDGTVLEVLETSNTSSINISGDLATINVALGAITTDNLKNADLAGTTLVNKVYTGFNGTREDDIYTVSFGMRDKTDVEILYEMENETQLALIELAGN